MFARRYEISLRVREGVRYRSEHEKINFTVATRGQFFHVRGLFCFSYAFILVSFLFSFFVLYSASLTQHEIENLRNISKYVKFRKVEDTALRSCYKDA